MVESEIKLVSKLISKYIKDKPTRITLKLDWENKSSTITLQGEKLNERREYDQEISFTSFARGVLKAYEKEFGELKVVPVSFREEIYENDRVSLDLYPTGSVEVFDIFVKYEKEKTGF